MLGHGCLPWEGNRTPQSILCWLHRPLGLKKYGEHFSWLGLWTALWFSKFSIWWDLDVSSYLLLRKWLAETGKPFYARSRKSAPTVILSFLEFFGPHILIRLYSYWICSLFLISADCMLWTASSIPFGLSFLSLWAKRLRKLRYK